MVEKQKSNNNDDDKCFQYAATVVLNYKKKLKVTQKEYQKLNPSLIKIIEINKLSIT